MYEPGAVFLDLNAWGVIAPEPDVVTTIVAVAAGTLSESDLAAWVWAHMRRPRRRCRTLIPQGCHVRAA